MVIELVIAVFVVVLWRKHRNLKIEVKSLRARLVEAETSLFRLENRQKAQRAQKEPAGQVWQKTSAGTAEKLSDQPVQPIQPMQPAQPMQSPSFFERVIEKIPPSADFSTHLRVEPPEGLPDSPFAQDFENIDEQASPLAIESSGTNEMPLPDESLVPGYVGDVISREREKEQQARQSQQVPPQKPQQPLQPLQPLPPGAESVLIERISGWLVGGNLLVRVGLLILFFGVSFLLKLAAEHDMLPLELRFAAVALGAVSLLVIGWRVCAERRTYGLLLQGGGVGILYMVIYAATLNRFNLLEPLAAFALLVAVCVLSAFLAVRQNSQSFAFFGAAGGFLAPVLVSTGSNNYVGLFSYYALLNAGIFAIAWFKAWRPLNLLGFLFTFTVGTVWGVTRYNVGDRMNTEFFLVLFFLFYVAVGLLYAVRREVELKSYIDGTLIFGTPLVFSGLQAGLMQPVKFGMAWSVVGLSAFYLLLAFALTRFRLERLRLLFESMLALGILFATLAVPLAFEGRLTSAIWAVEGAALVWAGLRQRRFLPLLSGIGLQIFSAVAFSLDIDGAYGSTPLLNSLCIGIQMLAFSSFFIAWRIQSPEAIEWLGDVTTPQSRLAGLWGLAWWIGGAVIEVEQHLSVLAEKLNAYVLFALLTAGLAYFARRKLCWVDAEGIVSILPHVLLVFAACHAVNGIAPFAAWGMLVWPLVFVFAYALLYCQGRDAKNTGLGFCHTLLFWTFCLLVALQLHHFVTLHVPEGAWRWSSWGFAGSLILIALVGLGTRLAWPVQRFAFAYLGMGAAPLVFVLAVWMLLSVVSNGDASPLPYLPVINPLELCQLLVFAAVIAWVRYLMRNKIQGWNVDMAAMQNILCYVVFALIFLWLNTTLLRSFHFYADVAYSPESILRSLGRQQVFVMAWIVFAFAGMHWLRNEWRNRFALAMLPLFVILGLWTLLANLSPESGNWGKWPLFNSLDLVLLAVFTGIACYLKYFHRLGIEVAARLPEIKIAAGISGFVWINAVLLRALHHWLDIPYNGKELFASNTVQAALSLLWGILALIVMVAAVRRAWRPLWFVGISFLVLTIVKLFFIDLADIGGIARVFSFIGVGLLLLLIGYLAPLPPRKEIET